MAHPLSTFKKPLNWVEECRDNLLYGNFSGQVISEVLRAIVSL